MPVKRTPGPAAAHLEKALKDLDRTTLEVGWFESAKYPDGTQVAMVAAAHEFGVPQNNLPPRSFMRPTLQNKRENWLKWLGQQTKKIMAGDADAAGVMQALGGSVAGEIRKSIAKVTEPPLQPATIEAKRRKLANAKNAGNLTKPLVETGHMLATLTHNVEQK